MNAMYRLHRSGAAYVLAACVLGSVGACDTPDPPHQATAQQIDDMEAQISGASSMSADLDYAALLRVIRDGSEVESAQAFRDYVAGAWHLEPTVRTRRLNELQEAHGARREPR